MSADPWPGDTDAGTVHSFDVHAGVGEIATEHRRVPFHCVSIADGSRVIAVGAPVTFTVAWRLGGEEAVWVRPAGW